MNLKRILFKTAFGLIFAFLGLILIFAAVVFWMADPLNLRAPKDQKLIAIFHAHREAFEKIQQMATEDAQYGWYFDSFFEGAELDEKYRQEYEKDPRYAWYFKSPYFEGGKLKEARRKEYQDLISEISPSLTIGTDYDSSMGFTFASGGILAIGPGWSKGIAYVPKSWETNGAVYGIWEENGTNYQQWHGIVLTNLDNAQSLPANGYMREIEPNWFLFYQRDDD